MDDQDLIARINELSRDEHELWERESRGEASLEEQERLRSSASRWTSAGTCCTSGVRAAPPD